MALIYDEGQLRAVARVVINLNPHMKGYTVGETVSMMKRTAEGESGVSKSPSYVSTRGYVLTSFVYEHNDTYPSPAKIGDIGIYASVSAYLFNEGSV